MLIGHEKQRQFLTKLAEAGNFSHAYLFAGEEKLGKKKMALVWASLILKNNLENPDLILITPQKKEIQISQIRELIWQLSLKPYSAPFKVAIIDEAHLMNQAAQNALLKTLEEPKEKTMLILISEYPEMLLPTVVSRCEKIKFYPVPKEAIEGYLKKQNLSAETTKEIINLALGKPGLAIDFMQDQTKLSDYQRKKEEINRILTASLNSRFQYAKDLSQTETIMETLNIWQAHLRNNFLKAINDQPLTINNQPLTINKLGSLLKLTQKIIFLINRTNVNTKLALEILMLNL